MTKSAIYRSQNAANERSNPQAGRREVTAAHAKVKRARDLKAQGLTPADIGKIIGASRGRRSTREKSGGYGWVGF